MLYLLLVYLLVACHLVTGHWNGSSGHIHGSSFVPDYYLSVTYENHTVACQHRMSVLVNGTSPGPALRLSSGNTSWVRVCNHMINYNTTMACEHFRDYKYPAADIA